MQEAHATSKPPVPAQPRDQAVAAGEPTAQANDDVKPIPRLRRGSTFQSRPMSTPPGGLPGLPTASSYTSPPASQVLRLRRGASYVKPSGGEAPIAPRLRRGSSFLNAREAASPPPSSGEGGVPRLRRGSSFMQSPPGTPASPSRVVSNLEAGFMQNEREYSTPVRRRSARKSMPLPRAGTFAAFGSPPKGVVSPRTPGGSSSDVQNSLSADKVGRARTCGMCGGCNSMPPWAPERMKNLTEEERETVRVEMRAKEEMGRLEAELRRQRVEDMAAVGRRLDKRRARGELVSEDGSGTVSGTVSEEARVGASIGDNVEELESVDLGDEPRNKGGVRKKRSRPGDDGGMMGEDISGPVGGSSVRGRMLEEDCGFCEGLDNKVSDLEQQLDVLKEVVKWCSNQEETAKQELEDENALKRSQTWMDKIANAYYGHSASAGERSRLKEELDVLRKATDFMFQKLQASGQ